MFFLTSLLFCPRSLTAPSPEPLVVCDVVNNTEANGDAGVSKATGNAPQDSLTSPNSGEEGSRLLRATVRRRRQRKVSVPDSQESVCQAGAQMEQLCEHQSSSSAQFSKFSEAPHADTEDRDAQIPAAPPCTDAGSEDHTCLHTPTSDCPPSAQEPSPTELKQKRAKRGRRSSALQKPQSSCDVEETGLREQAEGQPDNHWSSDSQEEVGGACPFVDLAPWQLDFNIEDVFKRAARRGQRSVRRSLRNQQSGGGAAGLAWLPHVSPDSVKEARRKTRKQRLSAALPVQPPPPEETPEASLDKLTAAGHD